jgi:hypothetical protein
LFFDEITKGFGVVPSFFRQVRVSTDLPLKVVTALAMLKRETTKKLKFKRWPKMGIGLNLRESDKLCAEECECSWDSK